jgi:lipoyl(octanoyl) transferase
MRSRACLLYRPGVIPYDLAWQWQRSLVEERRRQPDLEDVLLVMQHPPVYTLGQGASMDYVKPELAQQGVPLVRIERGGEVTYHCPGQLVAYPILNLRRHQPDLHWYLRQLEAVVIQAIAPYGLQGERVPGLTGVWVEGRKVAAVGIKVSRWITMHGVALNICPDLQGFQHIVPCGIADRPVGRLIDWRPTLTYEAVEAQVLQAFSQQFHLDLQPVAGNPGIQPVV